MVLAKEINISEKSNPDFQLSLSSNVSSSDVSQKPEEPRDPSLTPSKKRKPVKPLTPAALAAFQKAQDRTGLVYLSRIPPFMKPAKIRHLLSRFGEVGRVYLAAEDSKVRSRRIKYGGNRKNNFTEGWVEFTDKKVAKMVALALNGQEIGGKKGGHYHDDLWNIKYLPGFRWTHLTERIAYEKAERQQRLRAELAQATRENKSYLKNVEKAKMIKNMEEKKRKKNEVSNNDESASGIVGKSRPEQEGAIAVEEARRRFKQRKLVTREVDMQVTGGKVDSSDNTAVLDGKVKSVLGKVFGRM